MPGFQLGGLFRMLIRSNFTLLIKCTLVTLICAHLTIATANGTFSQPIDNCADTSRMQLGICVNTKNDTLNVLVQQQKQEQSAGQNSSTGSSTLADQRAQKTAAGTVDPAAASYSDSARCKNLYVNKAPNSPTVSDDDTVDNCPLPSDPEGGSNQDPGRIPTTRDILYMAATTIHADGAGLHKRPEGVSYTNKYIPTLVAATHPTQTHSVTLLGHDITVTLTATSYTWSWGDGTPDLTTTSPGMPWQEGMDPNTDPALIRHYYKAPDGWKSFLDGPYPSATRTITLTTTWAGTATNPFTGDTQTINGLVTTTETTGPFPLSHLIVNNTDTAEEKQGH